MRVHNNNAIYNIYIRIDIWWSIKSRNNHFASGKYHGKYWIKSYELSRRAPFRLSSTIINCNEKSLIYLIRLKKEYMLGRYWNFICWLISFISLVFIFLCQHLYCIFLYIVLFYSFVDWFWLSLNGGHPVLNEFRTVTSDMCLLMKV